MAWLLRRAASARAAGEGYGRHDDGEDSPANPSPAQAAAEAARHAEVPLALALLPLVLVVGVNALFTYLVFPALDLSFMAERYATLEPSRVTGLWSLLIALLVACTTLVVTRLGHWHDLKHTLNQGVFGFMLPLFNTASEVGYGAGHCFAGRPRADPRCRCCASRTTPLVSEAIAMNVLAGITGSSSGGLSIALQTLGNDYLAMAEAAAISPELLHRVAAHGRRRHGHAAALRRHHHPAGHLQAQPPAVLRRHRGRDHVVPTARTGAGHHVGDGVREFLTITPGTGHWPATCRAHVCQCRSHRLSQRVMGDPWRGGRGFATPQGLQTLG